MGALVAVGFPIGGAAVGALAGGAVGWFTEEPSDLPGFGALMGVAVGAVLGAVVGAVAGVAVLS